MMSHATFRQLEVFEAIARLGSFTRASEELHLTQPTVSMQMKKLTDAVGLPLFEQVGRRIHLTEAGKELAIAAREIMQSLERCDMSIAEMRGLKKGKLRLAVVSTAKYFVPRILGEFSRQHPGVEVSLKVTNRQRVLERAAENLDDLYILSQPTHMELTAKPFMENALLVMAHPEHPLTHERNIPLQRIAQEPFLMREEGSGTRLSVEHIFNSRGLKPNVRMELGSNEAIKQAIIAGLGISILSRHTLGTDGMGEPAVLDVEGFPVVNQWHIGHPHGKQLSVVASAFLDYLLKRMMKTS